MFQVARMKKENVIIYSNNSLQCVYLEYHLTAEKNFNIVQFHRANNLDIRWNPHLPPAKYPVLKIDPAKLPDE